MVEKVTTSTVLHVHTCSYMYLPPVLSHWECTLTPLVGSVQSPPRTGGGKEGQGQSSSCLMKYPGGIHPRCGVCGVHMCACVRAHIKNNSPS